GQNLPVRPSSGVGAVEQRRGQLLLERRRIGQLGRRRRRRGWQVSQQPLGLGHQDAPGLGQVGRRGGVLDQRRRGADLEQRLVDPSAAQQRRLGRALAGGPQ